MAVIRVIGGSSAAAGYDGGSGDSGKGESPSVPPSLLRRDEPLECRNDGGMVNDAARPQGLLALLHRGKELPFVCHEGGQGVIDEPGLRPAGYLGQAGPSGNRRLHLVARRRHTFIKIPSLAGAQTAHQQPRVHGQVSATRVHHRSLTLLRP